LNNKTRIFVIDITCSKIIIHFVQVTINMNRLQYSFLILIVLAGFGSCKKEDKAIVPNKLSIKFQTTFDGKQASIGQEFPVDQVAVMFERFNVFLSDITLVRKDGTEKILSEIEFLDFTPPDDKTSIMEAITRTYSVADGDYTAIKIGYGVKPSLNAKAPSEFGSDAVLAKAAGEYWDSWKSYIFMKLEAKGQLDADPEPEVGMIYHCGSDAVYRTGIKTINLNLSGGKAVDQLIEIDLKRIFYSDNQWFNVEAAPRTSDALGDVKVASQIMNNIDGAFLIK
jgi:hypothetical protein